MGKNGELYEKNVCYCCKKSILLLHNYEIFGDHFDLSVRCHDRSLCQFPRNIFFCQYGQERTGSRKVQGSWRCKKVGKNASGMYVIDADYNIVSYNHAAEIIYPELKKGEKCYRMI